MKRTPTVRVIALGAMALWLIAGCGDDSSTKSSDSTTTTASASSSSAPSPESNVAIFPSADSTEQFTEPTAAAAAFAVDYLGFTAPVVGEFRAGDSRSGEVPIRPTATGPETTVLVRQIDGDNWSVIGAVTANIAVDEPTSGATVSSPLTVTGTALAFEGTVQVQLRADGVADPIATTFVTGGGDVARAFDGTLPFDPPTATNGALVLFTLGAEDGRVWEATVLPVAFG